MEEASNDTVNCNIDSGAEQNITVAKQNTQNDGLPSGNAASSATQLHKTDVSNVVDLTNDCTKPPELMKLNVNAPSSNTEQVGKVVQDPIASNEKDEGVIKEDSPRTRRKKLDLADPIMRCDVCNCSFRSTSAEGHFKGKRHAASVVAANENAIHFRMDVLHRADTSADFIKEFMNKTASRYKNITSIASNRAARNKYDAHNYNDNLHGNVHQPSYHHDYPSSHDTPSQDLLSYQKLCEYEFETGKSSTIHSERRHASNVEEPKHHVRPERLKPQHPFKDFQESCEDEYEYLAVTKKFKSDDEIAELQYEVESEHEQRIQQLPEDDLTNYGDEAPPNNDLRNYEDEAPPKADLINYEEEAEAYLNLSQSEKNIPSNYRDHEHEETHQDQGNSRHAENMQDWGDPQQQHHQEKILDWRDKQHLTDYQRSCESEYENVASYHINPQQKESQQNFQDPQYQENSQENYPDYRNFQYNENIQSEYNDKHQLPSENEYNTPTYTTASTNNRDAQPQYKPYYENQEKMQKSNDLINYEDEAQAYMSLSQSAKNIPDNYRDHEHEETYQDQANSRHVENMQRLGDESQQLQEKIRDLKEKQHLIDHQKSSEYAYENAAPYHVNPQQKENQSHFQNSRHQENSQESTRYDDNIRYESESNQENYNYEKQYVYSANVVSENSMQRYEERDNIYNNRQELAGHNHDTPSDQATSGSNNNAYECRAGDVTENNSDIHSTL